VLNFQALKRKVLRSFETMGTTHHSIWCNIPEDNEASSTPCENLKPHTLSYLYYRKDPSILDAPGRQT